ncbi:hypothetical protein SSPO_002940 [Streptomyces antimycoticus]|uniref:Resolvase/invertase-type recombinase catalytic domain-containing protein n=1 Tax=Streptomyces antimycoticus TaxID=68175 RepID=A0A499ULB0_9ACTN|nr:hypothetical protein SSPO_002940 [Streptomyces antimycoticus]
MANLVYKRVSTDQQSTARQDLVLDEAGIEDPVVFEEDPGTSSRLHPLQRPRFRKLLKYGRPGDTVHISEMFCLVRGTGHIFDVLDVLHREQVALRIHDGAFSVMDLTARHPRTGELLSTVMFMVQTLAAAGELQRDLQRELTYDGLRAAEAKGNKGGRRPAVPAGKTDDVRTAYLEGRSIAALARDHDVSLGQEQPPLQWTGGRVTGGVDADRDLAVGAFAQGSAVLRSHGDRHSSVLGQRHVVDHPGGRVDPWQHAFADPPLHRRRVPGGLVHELLQVLFVAVRQPRGHGLDRLAAAVQHQSPQVAVAFGPLVSARHRREHVSHV